MIKAKGRAGKAKVTFTVHPTVGATDAAVCGEWNDWQPTADVMVPDGDGGFRLEVELPAGRGYRFRYLLDGHRWENDWEADAYIPNEYGEDDSFVDLSELVPAAKKTPTEKVPAKKAPAKKAAKKAAD